MRNAAVQLSVRQAQQDAERRLLERQHNEAQQLVNEDVTMGERMEGYLFKRGQNTFKTWNRWGACRRQRPTFLYAFFFR